MRYDVDFTLQYYSKDWFDDMMNLVNLTKPMKNELRDQYTYGRFYHGLFHISFLWHSHVTLSKLIKLDFLQHRKIANAIACHDIVMFTSSNEEASALWWEENVDKSYPKLFVNFDEKTQNQDIAWVSQAIRASANHFEPRPQTTLDEILTQWFLGLDLLPLAAPWSIFTLNTHLLRAEYSYLSDDEWREGRLKFLKMADQAPAIYQHPVLNEKFEKFARANIKRALA